MRPRNVLLVCGGKFHDFDYARLELLRRLYPMERVRTRVFEDFADVDAIAAADALVTFTADVIPTEPQQDALDQFLKSGKRWFALHGTNSAIHIDERGRASSPRVAPKFMEMLGSQFLAHPPKGPFEVHNAMPEHALVRGIDTFTVDDELYLIEQRGDIETLLYATFNGKAMRGFVDREFYSDERRPILYLRRWGDGEVLYLNLGHCRGHLDMQPLVEVYPEVERCSWESPVFDELVARGLRWVVGDEP